MDDKQFISQHKDLINHLYNTYKSALQFNRDPQISFVSNPQNSVLPLGKTGYYDPENMKVVIYITGRHIKDVLRSLGHELIHHNQNCQGKFVDVQEAEENYFSNNGSLRELEREAYETGNMIFRGWEESYKEEQKNGQIRI